ncbi:MAG: hypothetical protein QXD48_01010 [Candidatus Aenigmatarchaeota archaeon]
MSLISLTQTLFHNGWEEGDNIFTEYAVDWNYAVPGQWSRSQKDYLGTRWYIIEGLDYKAYQALLKHFGLEDYADEFPVERIITMSLKRLVEERRKKEKLYGLNRKEVFSDTLGDHSPAENFI